MNTLKSRVFLQESALVVSGSDRSVNALKSIGYSNISYIVYI